MLGVEVADLLTTTEATGDDGVALAEMLIEGVDDWLTTTEATGDDGVALTLVLPLALLQDRVGMSLTLA